ncbi:hypothetical protein QJS10_CPB14g00244 [Acorus calamus]|uniref:Uncharacterized protein n=1 Tax=Acorus calamus TaxID=4465 RepID=A0AAV9DCE7_ACOCL|nr:hypothetical protein QJS10_CPB14g00244 [Acorus calamus]
MVRYGVPIKSIKEIKLFGYERVHRNNGVHPQQSSPSKVIEWVFSSVVRPILGSALDQALSPSQVGEKLWDVSQLLMMAGEIEDCMSLQVDCLPTGSISFGRFEGESLSWERRSSFSHNRYLEEVERYSTPEKALMRQGSSLESPNGGECHDGENGMEDHMISTEEYEHHGHEVMQHVQYDEIQVDSDDFEVDVMESERDEVTSPFQSGNMLVNDMQINGALRVQCGCGTESTGETENVDDSCIVIEHKPIDDGVHIIIEHQPANETESVDLLPEIQDKDRLPRIDDSSSESYGE